MMFNSENIPYTAVSAVDVRKWPEIKHEINEAIPAVAKKLQWVVLLGAISFNDVTSKQPNYATRLTRLYYVKTMFYCVWFGAPPIIIVMCRSKSVNGRHRRRPNHTASRPP